MALAQSDSLDWDGSGHALLSEVARRARHALALPEIAPLDLSLVLVRCDGTRHCVLNTQ